MPRKSGRHAVLSCLSKAKYADYLTADSARMEKQKAYGKRLGAYLCRYCYGWHLTTAR